MRAIRGPGDSLSGRPGRVSLVQQAVYHSLINAVFEKVHNLASKSFAQIEETHRKSNMALILPIKNRTDLINLMFISWDGRQHQDGDGEE